MRAKHALTLIALAILISPVMGCNTTPVQDGAVAGGLLGAGAGAIIGNQVHGQSGEGALIGAATGALAGALIGDQVGKSRESQPVAVAPVQRQVVTPPAPPSTVVESGHYETRLVRTPSGETYEERVWVPDR